jgi:1-acyl-sn-glycerol-3-phosphate acyltransferase
MIGSRVTHEGPVSGVVAYWLGRAWMGLFGWDVVGEVPPGGKFVLVGAPHTSNWDFPFTLAAAHVFRLKISWMGKDSAFRGPLGVVMRGLGGIAIDRSSRQGVVEQVAKRFKAVEKLVVAMAPSGTRKREDYWKSGFYWIAHSAQVPILCSYLDYACKEACVGLSFVPTGDVTRDMDRIRGFYEGVQGKKRELASRIRLADEDA